jgi:hypothetical protein
MKGLHLRFGRVITFISVICLLISVYLALLSLETVASFLGVKINSSMRMQVLLVATCFFVTAVILLICYAIHTVLRRTFRL